MIKEQLQVWLYHWEQLIICLLMEQIVIQTVLCCHQRSLCPQSQLQCQHPQLSVQISEMFIVVDLLQTWPFRSVRSFPSTEINSPLQHTKFALEVQTTQLVMFISEMFRHQQSLRPSQQDTHTSFQFVELIVKELEHQNNSMQQQHQIFVVQTTAQMSELAWTTLAIVLLTRQVLIVQFVK